MTEILKEKLKVNISEKNKFTFSYLTLFDKANFYSSYLLWLRDNTMSALAFSSSGGTYSNQNRKLIKTPN